MTSVNDRGLRSQGIIFLLFKWIATPLNILLGTLLSAYGLAYGIWSLWHLFPFQPAASHAFREGIGHLLRGIELLLLAPLGYLVVAITYTHIEGVRRRLKVLNSTQMNAEQSDSKRHLEETFELVHRVKQSVAGIFVALLLTDLIDKVLDDRELSWMAISTEAMALTMCLVYYGVQKHSVRQSEGQLRLKPRVSSPQASDPALQPGPSPDGLSQLETKVRE